MCFNPQESLSETEGIKQTENICVPKNHWVKLKEWDKPNIFVSLRSIDETIVTEEIKQTDKITETVKKKKNHEKETINSRSKETLNQRN